MDATLGEVVGLTVTKLDHLAVIATWNIGAGPPVWVCDAARRKPQHEASSALARKAAPAPCAGVSGSRDPTHGTG
jgi:hypothetical protein